MIRVVIHKLNTITAQDEIAGEIIWDGKRLIVKPRKGHENLLNSIARSPIRWPEGWPEKGDKAWHTGKRIEICPMEDPEGFVDDLWRQYKGTYVRARVMPTPPFVREINLQSVVPDLTPKTG